jgi:hypothetical protein
MLATISEAGCIIRAEGARWTETAVPTSAGVKANKIIATNANPVDAVLLDNPNGRATLIC